MKYLVSVPKFTFWRHLRKKTKQ